MRIHRSKLLTLLLIVSACATVQPSRPEIIRLETSSWFFAESKIRSSDYGDQLVSASQIIDRKSGQTILDLSKTYPAFEWVLASEGPEGSIATLDHTIEGRANEVPIFIIRKADASWNEVLFRKSHFSGEVTELKLLTDKIQIRILIDQGLIRKKERSGTTKDQQGHVVDYQDWTYLFRTKSWILSR